MDRSDEPIEVSPAHLAQQDPAALPVGFVESAAARPARQGVARRRLEHGLYLLLEAGCAKIVRGITPRVLGAQAVNRRAELGPSHGVSFRFRPKALRFLLLVLKVEERIIQRHIRLLGDDDLLVELCDLLLHRADIRIRLCDECLGVLERLGRGLQGGHAGLGKTDEGNDVL